MNESNYLGSGKSVELYQLLWIPRVVQTTRRFNVGISHFPLVLVVPVILPPHTKEDDKILFLDCIIIRQLLWLTYIDIKIIPSKNDDTKLFL